MTRPSLLSRIRFRDAGTLLGLILISIVFADKSDVFLTEPNLINILQQSSINACIALGMTLVIISGGIDLSVGPVAARSAVLAAAMLVAGVPVTLTKLAAYMISGLMAAVAALVLIGRLGAAEPTLGTLWELDASAAAAIGGASLMGGVAALSAHSSVASSPAPCATG